AELLERGTEHDQSSRIVLRERALAAHDVERGAMLGSRFREQQRAVRKIAGRESRAPRNGCAGGLPVQPTGDHEVQHDEILAVEGEHDPLAQALYASD